MISRCLLAAGLVAATMIPATAAADDAVGDAPPVDAPRLVAPAKRLVVHALLEVNLSKGAAFEPLSLAPDLWYGVNPDLTIGLIHSSQAATGFLGGVGDGLCLTGESHGCTGFYDGAGLVGRYHLGDRALIGGAATAALDGGLIAGSFDPFALSLKLGAVGRWQRGKLALEAEASLWFGFSQRDAGNIERFYLPLSATYVVKPRLAVVGQLGVFSPFKGFRAEVVVAMSAGVQYVVRPGIVVDAVLSLPHWLDTDRQTYGLDARTLTFGVGHAF